MSGHPASEHAPSDHEDHDAQPAGLDPDEPHTPYWVTALGGAIFLFAALFFLVTAGDDADAKGAAPGSPAAEEGAAPAGQPPADEPPSEE
jgi:hypothetical protein